MVSIVKYCFLCYYSNNMVLREETMQTNMSERSQEITKELQSHGGFWVGPRDYETMTLERVSEQFSELHDVILAHTDDANVKERAIQAHEKTQQFAETAFRAYTMTAEELLGRPIDSVFAVPLRADGKNPIYSTDTDAFLPLLSREFGVSPELQLRATLGMPPSVIETNFQGDQPGEAGATIFVPLFSTMMEDIPDKQELLRVGSPIMQKAAELTHIRLGAKVLGLGGTFPKVSMYGAGFKYHPKYNMDKLVTTTGHGGTVHLILETVKALQTTETFKDQDTSIGIIGAAGSIGWSTIEGLHELVGKLPMRINDHRYGDLQNKVQDYKYGDMLQQDATALEVLQQSNVIVSAVTRPIDLDVIDPNSELDLRGKAIIDDSEPKAFKREQVEARGGYLLNVVAEAKGDFKALQRDGLWTGGSDKPYNFGNEAGLYGNAAWGCDTERVIISWADAYKEAVTQEVTPDNVRNIGRLCLEAGIGVGEFQSFSRPVHIP